MTILAGLSPAGALIVRAGEPKVLNLSLAQADGTTPQNLEGRTFALIVRRSSRPAPMFTINAELSPDALYVSVMMTAEMATAIYEAGYAQALSYDIVELTGGASTTRFTERVLVQVGPNLPSDIVPIFALLPYTEAMIRPDVMVITERGAAGDSSAALQAADLATQAAEQATEQVAAAITDLGEFTSERSAEIDDALLGVGTATDAAEAVVQQQAANLATVAAAVDATEQDRSVTETAAATATGAATLATTTVEGTIKGASATPPAPLQNAKGVLIVECADSTGWQAQAIGGSRTAYQQLSRPGCILEGNAGFALMASSGWKLSLFVNGAATPGFVGPVPGDPYWNLDYVKSGGAPDRAAMSVNLADALAYLATYPASQKIIFNLSLGINDVILDPAVGILTQAQIEDRMIGFLRTAVARLHAARPTMLIVLRTPNPIFARTAGAFITDTAYPTFSTDLAYASGLVNKWNAALRNSYQQVAFEQAHTLLHDVWLTTFGYPDALTDNTVMWTGMADNVHPNTTTYYSRFMDWAQLVFGPRNDPYPGRVSRARLQAVANTGSPESYYARFAEASPQLWDLVFFGRLSGAQAAFLDITGPMSVDAGAGSAYNDVWIPALRGRTTIIVQVGEAAAQRFTSFSAGASGQQVVRITGIAPNAALQAFSGTGVPVKVWAPKAVSTGSTFLDGERQSTKYRATYEASVSASGSGNATLRLTLDARKAGMFRKDQLVSLAGLKLVVAANSTTYDLSAVSFSSGGTPILTGNTMQVDIGHALGIDFSTVAGPALLAVDANADDPSAFSPSTRLTSSAAAAVSLNKRMVNGVLRLTYSTGPVVVTLPPASSITWSIGDTIEVVRAGTTAVTFAPGAGVTINSAGALLGISAQFKRAWVRYVSADTWDLYGDLA